MTYAKKFHIFICQVLDLVEIEFLEFWCKTLFRMGKVFVKAHIDYMSL